MTHPNFSRRIHRFLELIWRENIRLDPKLPGMEPVSLSLKEAKAVFLQEFPELRFMDGELLLHPPLLRNEAYWQFLKDDLRKMRLNSGISKLLKSPLGAAELAELAQAQHRLLGNPREAGRLLELGLKRARSSQDLLRLALAWEGIPKSREKIQELLEEATQRTEGLWERCLLARVREALQEEDQGSRGSCQELITALGKEDMEYAGFTDLVTLARTKLEFHDDQARAEATLKLAEEKLEKLEELPLLARTWLTLMGNREEAWRLLSKAPICLETTQWLALVQGDVTARRSLESVAGEEEQFHLKELALCWKQLFNQQDKAKRFLDRAREQAKDNLSLRELARTLKTGFGEEVEAKRLLERAQQKAEDSYELIATARDWVLLFGDEFRARNLLFRAEGTKRELNYHSLAEAWLDILYNESEGERLLKRFELESVRIRDHIMAARLWLWSLRRPEEARATLILAGERLAHSNEGWSKELWELAGAWEELFPGSEEAGETLERAQEQAEELDQLIELSWVWQHQFGDSNRAAGALEQAEEKANDLGDYVSLAEAWLELSRGRAKAQRLLMKAEEKVLSITGYRKLAGLWHQLEEVATSAMLLLEAEKQAEEPDELDELAEDWERLFEDREKAEELRELAERNR